MGTLKRDRAIPQRFWLSRRAARCWRPPAAASRFVQHPDAASCRGLQQVRSSRSYSDRVAANTHPNSDLAPSPFQKRLRPTQRTCAEFRSFVHRRRRSVP
jgi:hypothetical protein